MSGRSTSTIKMIYPEWPYRQGGCFACWRVQGCKIEYRLWLSCTDLYYMHETLRGYCPWGWGWDQSIGSTVSDAIIRCWLWSTATRSSILGYFSRLLQVVDNWPTFCGGRFSTGRLLAKEDFTFFYERRSALPSDSHTSAPPPPISGGNDEHSWIKNGPPLMKGLAIQKNIPVSENCDLTTSSQLTRERSRVYQKRASYLRPKACLHW